jgi:hypothetical protein
MKPIRVRQATIGAPLLLLALLFAPGGCGNSTESDGDAGDADLSAPEDADLDEDIAVDADHSADAETDIVRDSAVDTDMGGDADEDGEANRDADTDTEEDAERDGDADGDAEMDGEGEELPMEPLFAFAVMADPHVNGSGANADRLTAAVAWINENTEEQGVEVVLILGDICWGGGMELARDILDELEAPYVPIIGDNEVHVGEAERFHTVFSDQYELLSATFEGWQQAAVPVWNPVTGEENWFTNMAFDLRGIHFVGLDWAPRAGGGIAGEMGEIHDFDGGTFPWLEEVIEELPTDVPESIVMASHIPMHTLAFTSGGVPAITRLLSPYGDALYANFAGHVHLTYDLPMPSGGYHVYVTDATHDDENTVRVVHVEGNGRRFAYTQELVAVE